MILNKDNKRQERHTCRSCRLPGGRIMRWLELASRHPANGIAIRRNPASPLDLTRFAQVEAVSSNLPAAFQKQNPIPSDGVLFCDYPQVLLFAPSHIARKGECEGETFAGFPTRVQSPARRRPILRSKIAAPKKYDHPKGGRIFFGAGDEARTRFPASREWHSHSQEPCLTSKFDALRAGRGSEFKPARGIPKRNTILTDGVSFWSGRRGSNSLPGIPRMA